MLKLSAWGYVEHTNWNWKSQERRGLWNWGREGWIGKEEKIGCKGVREVAMHKQSQN